MIRVSGPNIFFYSHEFSDNLLKSIATGIEPLAQSQIQKCTRIVNNQKRHGLSLLVADDRVIIFPILDCIQQIISKIWTFVLLWIFYFFCCSVSYFSCVESIHNVKWYFVHRSRIVLLRIFIWNTCQLLIQATEGHSIAIFLNVVNLFQWHWLSAVADLSGTERGDRVLAPLF